MQMFIVFVSTSMIDYSTVFLKEKNVTLGLHHRR